MTTHSHNQAPTAGMTEADYDTLLTHLGEQLAHQCQRAGYPADEAGKAACDALANTFGTADNQTVLDWLKAAGARLCVSTDDCVGV